MKRGGSGPGPRRIGVSGAAGRMGSEVVKMVLSAGDLVLAGTADPALEAGADLPARLGLSGVGTGEGGTHHRELPSLLEAEEPDVVVDFTTPKVVMENIEAILKSGVHAVVGTTGLTGADLERVREWTSAYPGNAIIAPNFALGAVLMMRFVAEAAPYFRGAEIVEKHHPGKVDAPSGTALMTAEMMNRRVTESGSGKRTDEGRGREGAEAPEAAPEAGDGFIEKLPGARGGRLGGIRIHSMRLPGLVAHQEVILGTEGQTLTIRHDSTDRSSFMPGVRMAIDRVDGVEGLVHGLDKLIFEE